MSTNFERDENNEAESMALTNPAPPPDVDWEKLKGDRIGDTVYSGKWCIQTIMNLMQSNAVKSGNVKGEEEMSNSGDGVKMSSVESEEEEEEIVDMEEELQNQVGVLWDMTSTIEVCQYLHSVGAMDSICHVISQSRCPRATEMCVGMLANIISHAEMWELLSEESTLFVLVTPLLINSDQPVLVEVTRFFNTALSHGEHKVCYNTLCECQEMVCLALATIFSGSTHVDLLSQTAELTCTLMDMDEQNNCFTSWLDNTRFINSVLEASKEIGYDREKAGQNILVGVLYSFTTFPSVVFQDEALVERFLEANCKYLKCLCSSLHLSNHCHIITRLIASINHSLRCCDQTKNSLASNITVMKCTLQTLLGINEKLGNSSSPQHSPSRWTPGHDSQQDKNKDSGSWSERAESIDGKNTTPDLSSLRRETEVPWSERRFASPLSLDHKNSSPWKRPLVRRKKSEQSSDTNENKLNKEFKDNENNPEHLKRVEPENVKLQEDNNSNQESMASVQISEHEDTILSNNDKSPSVEKPDGLTLVSTSEDSQQASRSSDLVVPLGIPDKYRMLLETIQEFLTDFINALGQELHLSSLMSYLNSSRSEREVKSLISCLSNTPTSKSTLHKLLKLAQHFKAKRLEFSLKEKLGRNSF